MHPSHLSSSMYLLFLYMYPSFCIPCSCLFMVYGPTSRPSLSYHPVFTVLHDDPELLHRCRCRCVVSAVACARTTDVIYSTLVSHDSSVPRFTPDIFSSISPLSSTLLHSHGIVTAPLRMCLHCRESFILVIFPRHFLVPRFALNACFALSPFSVAFLVSVAANMHGVAVYREFSRVLFVFLVDIPDSHREARISSCHHNLN